MKFDDNDNSFDLYLIQNIRLLSICKTRLNVNNENKLEGSIEFDSLVK